MLFNSFPFIFLVFITIILYYNKNLLKYQIYIDFELKELKNLLDYFQNKGTKIIFFEMRIEQSLANSIKAKQQRKIIKYNFKNISWLNEPDNTKYITSDGIHLIYKSAYEFSKVFIKEVK